MGTLIQRFCFPNSSSRASLFDLTFGPHWSWYYNIFSSRHNGINRETCCGVYRHPRCSIFYSVGFCIMFLILGSCGPLYESARFQLVGNAHCELCGHGCARHSCSHAPTNCVQLPRVPGNERGRRRHRGASGANHGLP